MEENLTKPWMLVALLAVGTILNVGYQQAAKAFTLVEIDYLPAVQLIADQRADITVTNVSGNSVTVVLTLYRDNGTMMGKYNIRSRRARLSPMLSRRLQPVR